MSLKEKFLRWWYFSVRNTVVRSGESGGFKWVFRRFWLEISSVSGNFKARFTAAEHPYGYLLAGKDDKNIEGFCQMVYMVSMMLTTDQGFVDDVSRAVKKYDKRIQASNPVVEDDDEERMAIEEMKALQEHLDLPKKERRKVERGIDGRFKKAVKDASEKQ